MHTTHEHSQGLCHLESYFAGLQGQTAEKERIMSHPSFESFPGREYLGFWFTTSCSLVGGPRKLKMYAVYSSEALVAI
jgi:hypothetical protein